MRTSSDVSSNPLVIDVDETFLQSMSNISSNKGKKSRKNKFLKGIGICAIYIIDCLSSGINLVGKNEFDAAVVMLLAGEKIDIKSSQGKMILSIAKKNDSNFVHLAFLSASKVQSLNGDRVAMMATIFSVLSSRNIKNVNMLKLSGRDLEKIAFETANSVMTMSRFSNHTSGQMMKNNDALLGKSSDGLMQTFDDSLMTWNTFTLSTSTISTSIEKEVKSYVPEGECNVKPKNRDDKDSERNTAADELQAKQKNKSYEPKQKPDTNYSKPVMEDELCEHKDHLVPFSSNDEKKKLNAVSDLSQSGKVSGAYNTGPRCSRDDEESREPFEPFSNIDEKQKLNVVADLQQSGKVSGAYITGPPCSRDDEESRELFEPFSNIDEKQKLNVVADLQQYGKVSGAYITGQTSHLSLNSRNDEETRERCEELRRDEADHVSRTGERDEAYTSKEPNHDKYAEEPNHDKYAFDEESLKTYHELTDDACKFSRQMNKYKTKKQRLKKRINDAAKLIVDCVLSETEVTSELVDVVLVALRFDEKIDINHQAQVIKSSRQRSFIELAFLSADMAKERGGNKLDLYTTVLPILRDCSLKKYRTMKLNKEQYEMIANYATNHLESYPIVKDHISEV